MTALAPVGSYYLQACHVWPQFPQPLAHASGLSFGGWPCGEFVSLGFCCQRTLGELFGVFDALVGRN